VGLFGPPDVEKLKAKGDVPGLSQALVYKLGSDKDRPVRRAAAEALGTLGEPAARTLVQALGEEADVTDALVDSLSSIGAPAVEHLLDLGGRSSRIAASTETIVARIGAPAVEALAAALERYPLRAAAADTLDRIGWKPGKDRAGAAYAVARGRWDECVEIGAAAVEPLVAVLPTVAAIEALGRIGDVRAVEPLVALLSKSDRDAGRAAAEALGKIGDRAAVPSLLLALEGNDDQMSCAAAEALGKIGDSEAVPGLIARLRWGAAAAAAVEALGKIGDGRAVEPLIRALEAERGDSEHLAVRKAAAEALGRIGDPRAVGPLIATVDRSPYYVGKTAIGALGRIGDRTAVVTLESSLRSPYEELRGAAADALDGAGWRPGKDVAGASYWAVKGNWAGCIETGAATREHLLAALKHGGPDQRKAAADLLARLGQEEAAADPPAVPAQRATWMLVEGLRGAGREAAAETLVKMGGQAVPALISGLRHAESSATVAEVLGQIGDPRAVEPLVAALEGGSWAYRKASARALLAIYESGGLDQGSKQKILSRVADITTKHDDGQNHYDGYPPGYCGHGDGFEHGDRGIGVPFPV
jgi:HEAT repeat protein